MDAKTGSVKKMSEEKCKDYKYDPKFDKDWNDAVAPFKKVEWVPRDSGEGKQLVMSKE